MVLQALNGSQVTLRAQIIIIRYYYSHIPDGPGYQEKFYFNPGDTGIQVWKTKYATIGVLICWDQWFPEPARASALMVYTMQH
jgi:N-carbamoylputrescine amidase